MTPEFQEFKHKQLGYTLLGPPPDGLDDFVFPPEIEKEHAVIGAFVGLCQAQKTLSQCEYYFRRFPFDGVSVSRGEHFQNICEFYFSSFYIIRSRIKLTLNNLKVTCPNSKLNVKKFLQAFDKEFHHEIRARHQVHHYASFADREINRISLTGVLSEFENIQSKFWGGQHVVAYRKFSKEWSLIARRRAGTMQLFVEAVACGLLTEAEFLRFPDGAT
jgi:hypothetical protein